ncbi:cell division protein FtsZ [Metamycoplasma spumans]|uniref:cell division protein FtsZ n=1 Tax=Metamycoplasma spumans TaxID=92406 RepID=UPI00048763F6
MDEKEVLNYNPVAKIKVIGVGGGGNNSIQALLDTKLDGLDFIVVNTDKQALARFNQNQILHIGDKRGIGAGANPEIGRSAAEGNADEIKSRLKGADLVLITAGMGGGTGTGASPVIAKIAKEQGSLVMAIVTTPFMFEGRIRSEVAKKGIEEIKKYVDAFIIVSNDKLTEQYGEVSFNDAFKCANNVLKQTIRTIIDVIAVPSFINLDFADLETVIKNKGEAVVGIGQASGEDRTVKAITSAISSPILESSIVGATDAIVHFSVSSKVTLNEIKKAILTMREIVGKDINIIFGINNSISDESNKLGEVFVSVIATGLKDGAPKAAEDIQAEVITNIESSSSMFVNSETSEMLIENIKNGSRYPIIEEDKDFRLVNDDMQDVFKS